MSRINNINQMIKELTILHTKNSFLTREYIANYISNYMVPIRELGKPYKKEILIGLKNVLLYSKNDFHIEYLPSDYKDTMQYFTTTNRFGSKLTSSNFSHHCFIPFQEKVYVDGIDRLLKYVVNHKVESRGILSFKHANENVHLKTSSVEDTNMVISYVRRELNPYLNDLNPLLPTKLGVGYLFQQEDSAYYQFVSNLIYGYLNAPKNKVFENYYFSNFITYLNNSLNEVVGKEKVQQQKFIEQMNQYYREEHIRIKE